MRPWTWRLVLSGLCGYAVFRAFASEDVFFSGLYMLLAIVSLMFALSVRSRSLY